MISKERRQELREAAKSDIRAELSSGFTSQLKVLRRRIKALRKEISKIESYDYGSYVPGRRDWQDRWNVARGKRVLLFAPVDASGSFFKWAEAINRHTDYAARLITLHRHKHDYPLDLLLPFPDLDSRCGLDRLLDEADIFHIKDEPGFFSGSNSLPRDLFSKWSKPQIFTAHGGYMRKLANSGEFQNFVGQFNARVAMTPDLNYNWFGGKYIPHAIDEESFDFKWRDSRIIAHSPTRSEDPEKKGTQFLQQATANLEKEPWWSNWNIDLITNVSYAECIDRKCKASLFFDQAGEHTETAFGIQQVIGWYGNSAIEAMAFGIPTIAHLSEEALTGADRAGVSIRDSCPIIRVDRSADGMAEALRDFCHLSPSAKRNFAERTRNWTLEFHGYRRVGRELASLYDETLRQE